MNIKKKDTLPNRAIILKHGAIKTLTEHFGYARDTIKKYIRGGMIGAESQARAKEVREYALNHLQGVYLK